MQGGVIAEQIMAKLKKNGAATFHLRKMGFYVDNKCFYVILFFCVALTTTFILSNTLKQKEPNF